MHSKLLLEPSYLDIFVVTLLTRYRNRNIKLHTIFIIHEIKN